jgi:acetate kinase
MSNILNKKSGVLGISELTSDNRDIIEAANNGHEGAELARAMQTYQITKVVGSYVAAMNGVDAIVFTGGIGENTASIRANVCKNLEFMGLKLDEQLNASTILGAEGNIATADSKVKVYVIPTEEELVIARDTAALVAGK